MVKIATESCTVCFAGKNTVFLREELRGARTEVRIGQEASARIVIEDCVGDDFFPP